MAKGTKRKVIKRNLYEIEKEARANSKKERIRICTKCNVEKKSRFIIKRIDEKNYLLCSDCYKQISLGGV